MADKGVRRFDKHQRLRRLKFQLAGVIGIVQTQREQRAVGGRQRKSPAWKQGAIGEANLVAFIDLYVGGRLAIQYVPVSCQLSFCNNRVFQRRETFGEDPHAIAGLQRDAGEGCRSEWHRRDSGWQTRSARLFGGIALEIAGIPAVGLAAVDFGDDGQIVHAIHRGESADGQKPSRHLALIAGR
jgi:hypothetical protein